ncbi:MAG: hypothetical protein HQL49_10720 [Gammaproteobacteria bacterium]|nr:hypothetical protein [Gammaproteobacteria bacterium]
MRFWRGVALFAGFTGKRLPALFEKLGKLSILRGKVGLKARLLRLPPLLVAVIPLCCHPPRREDEKPQGAARRADYLVRH